MLPEFLSRKLVGGVDGVQFVIAIGVAISLLLFGIFRRSAAVFVIPLALIGYFAISQFIVVHEVGKASANYRAVPGVGSNASWIDQVVPSGQRVSLILGTPLGPDTDRLIYWQLLFFNRTVFDVSSWSTDYAIATESGAVTSAGGQPPSLNPWVITPTSHFFQGETVVVNGPLAMQNPVVPLVLERLTSGISPDDWTGPTAAINYFAATDIRTVHVHIDRADIPDGVPPTKATVSIGTLVTDDQGAATIGSTTGTKSVEISNSTGADFDLPVPPAPFRVELSFEPSFKRSDYGEADTRDLGAHVLITLGSETISR